MRRYKTEQGRKRLVVQHNEIDGYEVAWTDSCSGCFEAGEYMGLAHHYTYDSKAKCYRGHGCDECGYTGKRRSSAWIPFNLSEYMALSIKINGEAI